MKMFYRKLLVLLVFPVLWLSSESCGSRQGKSSGGDQVLTVFHAGSLAVPLKKIAEAFEKENPGVEVRLEAAGSLACVRKVTELHRRCDVMALADYSLIDKLMIPDHASWNIRFAANELCLAYTGKSREAARIDTGNWYRILMEPDVRYGRSDPDSDPCGYRTILALKLNGIMHPGEDNWQRLLDKDRRYIRGKETDLNALLESQTIDYMFNYRSVAVQHGYHFVELPDSINLSLPELDGWYAKASIDVRGSEPGSKVTQTGSSIVYGVTIPSHAENPELADTFVRFMLGSTGREIMAKSGQIPLDPEFSPKSKVANSLF